MNILLSDNGKFRPYYQLYLMPNGKISTDEKKNDGNNHSF